MHCSIRFEIDNLHSKNYFTLWTLSPSMIFQSVFSWLYAQMRNTGSSIIKTKHDYQRSCCNKQLQQDFKDILINLHAPGTWTGELSKDYEFSFASVGKWYTKHKPTGNDQDNANSQIWATIQICGSNLACVFCTEIVTVYFDDIGSSSVMKSFQVVKRGTVPWVLLSFWASNPGIHCDRTRKFKLRVPNWKKQHKLLLPRQQHYTSIFHLRVHFEMD